MATNSRHSQQQQPSAADSDAGRDAVSGSHHKAPDGAAGGHQMGATAARHPAPARHQVPVVALWFGLFGAPAAWSVQSIVNYVLASHTCFPKLYPLVTPTIGHTGLAAVVVGVSIAALLVGIATLVTSIWSWRETRHETGGQSHWAIDTGEGRTRFMALSGILLSVMFTISILVHGAAAALTNPCWY